MNANVTLIYCHEWIELHANTIKNEKLCMLRDALLSGLECAAEVQNCDSLVPKLAFFCPCKQQDGNQEQPPALHLASITPCKEELQCRQDSTVFTPMTDQEKQHRHLWLKSLEGSYDNLQLNVNY